MSCLCLLEELLFTLQSIQSLPTFFLVHVIQIIAHFRIQTRRNDQHYSSTTLFGRCTLYSICTKMLGYVSSSVNLFKSGFAHLRETISNICYCSRVVGEIPIQAKQQKISKSSIPPFGGILFHKTRQCAKLR